MAPNIRTAHAAGSILLFLLLAGSLMVLTVAARENVSMQITPGPNLNVSNYSISTDGQPANFIAGPTPITIFRVELNQSTLPGPRDMGFGPSVIDLSIAPQLFAVIFIIILIGLVAWVFLKRKSEKRPDTPEPKE